MEQSADRSHAVARSGEAAGCRRDVPGTKFQQHHYLAVFIETFLAIEYRAGAIALDHQGNDRHQRQRHGDQHDGDHNLAKAQVIACMTRESAAKPRSPGVRSFNLPLGVRVPHGGRPNHFF